MLSLLLTLLFTSLAYTAPLTTSSNSSPTAVHHSRNFTLKSHVLTPPNAAFDNLVLEPYHIYPAFNYATLFPKTKKNPGIVGYLNGTEEELQDEIGDLLFHGGADFPYGFVIDSVNSTYNPIEINAGPGTKGIFIDQGVIKVHSPISGGFYGMSPSFSSTLNLRDTSENPVQAEIGELKMFLDADLAYSVQQAVALWTRCSGVLQAQVHHYASRVLRRGIGR